MVVYIKHSKLLIKFEDLFFFGTFCDNNNFFPVFKLLATVWIEQRNKKFTFQLDRYLIESLHIFNLKKHSISTEKFENSIMDYFQSWSRLLKWKFLRRNSSLRFVYLLLLLDYQCCQIIFKINAFCVGKIKLFFGLCFIIIFQLT